MLRRIDAYEVGKGEHRSGWPYCMQALSPLFDDTAEIAFDDFCERTFLYRPGLAKRIPEGQPWVGMLHHPPDYPEWYQPGGRSGRLQPLVDREDWRTAVSSCRMFITLGDNLTAWLVATYPQIPVVTLRHPTGRPIVTWSPERFRKNKWKKLVQVGWFLRNTFAIYQAEVPGWLQKVHIHRPRPWVERALFLCKQRYTEYCPDRKVYSDVDVRTGLPDTYYDLMFAENVIFTEVISAVANNVVVECIARNTPVCINRHPGPEYYLGPDYPLFYDSFSEIPQKLTMENILAAHEYLVRLDKWWIRGGMFRECFQAACAKFIPECRAQPVSVPCSIAQYRL